MVTLLCIMCGTGVCFNACSLYECLRVFKVSLIFSAVSGCWLKLTRNFATKID